MANEKKPGKLYICKRCAEVLGHQIDESKPYMWHICEICGDGRKDLYEVEEEPPKIEEPIVECKKVEEKK